MNAKEKLNFSLYEYHNLFKQDLLVSYKGPIDERILSVLGDYIIILLEKTPQTRKKIFKIFIELAHNISLYSVQKKIISESKKIGEGTIAVGEYNDYFTFITGNLVNNDDIIPVIEKCEFINSLDRESLRKYRREQRRMPYIKNGEGNIGLVQVALTAAGPLEIEVVPVNEKLSFFSIAVKISKIKK